MKNIDDLESFWKRFCANPVKTLIYSAVLIVLALGSVMTAAYVNGYFTELGKQAKTSAAPQQHAAGAVEPVRAAVAEKEAPSSYPADLLQMRKLADAITAGDKRSAQLIRLVETSLQRGELGFAAETARTIPYERMKSDALAQVADAYAQKGDSSGALAVAQMIPTPAARNKALSKITSAQS